MTTNEIRETEKKYSKLSDKDLAREFVKHDQIVLKLWNNVDDDTSDEHQILKDIITDRFVAAARIGMVWNDVAQNWVRPDWKPNKVVEFKKVEYWIGG